MAWWQIVSLIITIIGGLNWLLVGLFQFDLVAAICGGMHFGETNAASRIIYIVVGIAAIVCITIFWVK
jgi:uncharacterized protein